MNGRSTRPSPALLVALVALCLAMGGAAYAGSKIATSDLKRGAVTAAKLHRNAVTTKKIKNDVITGAKVNEATLGTVPNSDAVGGLPANNLVRVASASVEKSALVATNGDAAQTSIEAPRSGFLQMTASSDVFTGATDAGITCSLIVDGQVVKASARTIAPVFPPGEDNCDTNATVPIAAGSHTVKFHYAGIDSATVDETTLDVLFVPFDSNGA